MKKQNKFLRNFALPRLILPFFAAIVFVIIAGSVRAATPADVARPNPALTEILRRIRVVKATGQTPVVAMDLDDTMFLTSHRKWLIFRDAAKYPPFLAAFPEDMAKLRTLTPDLISYKRSVTYKALAIENPVFITVLDDFWQERFFSNEYCRNDPPIPGAPEYAQELYKAGAHLVYLTGRDSKRMEAGTIESLLRIGAPWGGDRVEMMMKPDPKAPDHEFKERALPELRKLGVLVAMFDNEPANIDAFKRLVPYGVGVFLNTERSDMGKMPSSKVVVINSFLDCGQILGASPKKRVDFL